MSIYNLSQWHIEPDLREFEKNLKLIVSTVPTSTTLQLAGSQQTVNDLALSWLYCCMKIDIIVAWQRTKRDNYSMANLVAPSLPTLILQSTNPPKI